MNFITFIQAIDDTYNQLCNPTAEKDILYLSNLKEEYLTGIEDFRDLLIGKLTELNTEGIFRECKDCGRTFTIPHTEVKWLEDRGLKIFARCKVCRDERRKVNAR